ncbi:outer membrane protein assembly factor BamA [Candidiatus Paracoxiella cheracis]|uniref:outer membrane protein assembly factor BamA n=1 Tax=Candidiatus Paracoxiella cheracis TaxID=3405120 RepID=UPI003BF4F4B6
MSLIKRFTSIFLFIFFIISPALAENGFVIRHIQIEGLQRISVSTVRSYMPIHEGQRLTANRSNAIITSLYKTGFFYDVQLARRGGELIVRVKERPTIGLIQINGNKAISTKKLKPILKSLDIVEGEVYDPTAVNEISQGLQQQYGKMGYHAATVTTRVVKEPRNRVALYINVNEGTIAKVHSIRFVGNHAFSQHKLREQFKLTTPGLFTWINHRDRYSKEKLDADLQSLTNFYSDHGYLRFRILSQQVTMTPDRRGVNILIHISEGPLYRIGHYQIVGETFGKKQDLYKLIPFKSGDVFSRQEVIDTNKALGNYLANFGYAFADVSAIPNVDDQRHVVDLTFRVVPGTRVYVRRINFFGNDHTNQEVLRREMRQFEGSSYSLSKIQESKRRLQLLPFLSKIEVTPQPVPGTTNEVDLNVHAKEVAAGRASIQGGYSDYYGFLYGASISEPNFLGTGKYVSLGFQNSEYYNNYSFTYNNPYYTASGVSRGFTIYYSHVKPNPRYNLQSYFLDGYGIDLTYGFPISERNTLSLGYGFEHVAISRLNPIIAAPSTLAFLNIQPVNSGTCPSSTCSLGGHNYNQFKLTGGWSYNGLDRYIFPTKGFYNGIGAEIGAPIVKSSIGYYTVSDTARFYQPLGAGFIINLLGTVAYGNGLGKNPLPFYKNFYAGGINSVPAFAPNSLGPINRYNQNAAIGGNLEMVFGFHVIFPNFISDRLRTAIVFDAGNVFQTPIFQPDVAVPARNTGDSLRQTTPQIIQDDKVALKNLRPSLGLAISWYSPLGPIDLSVAFPLNKRMGDDPQAFQFTFGTSL